MCWLIVMCVVVIFAGACIGWGDRAAKARFLAQYPHGVSGEDLSREIQELLKNGQRIQALKQFKKDTGLGLKDAREILDTLSV
jgi:ribosomal protein L7/L12